MKEKSAAGRVADFADRTGFHGLPVGRAVGSKTLLKRPLGTH
jgi:hypothetical protein